MNIAYGAPWMQHKRLSCYTKKKIVLWSFIRRAGIVIFILTLHGGETYWSPRDGKV